jgi:hypothetical protein
VIARDPFFLLVEREIQQSSRGSAEARASWGAAISAPTNSKPDSKTKAAHLKGKAGGRYKFQPDVNHSTVLNIYFSGQEKIGPA